MKLFNLIDTLLSELNERGNYTTAVFSRTNSYDPKSTLCQYPILDVFIDDEEQEVNLLLGEESEIPLGLTEALTVQQLLQRLTSLGPHCRDYLVFSASALKHLPRDEEYYQAFTPLFSFTVRDSDQILALLEYPREQWISNT